MTSSRKVLIGIIALILVIYVPFLNNELLNYDDTTLITHNPAVVSFDLGRSFTTFDPELYVPLTLLTYQIEYLVSGESPWLYHATNLALHIGNTILIVLLLTRLTRNKTIALLVGALFAVHPINAEAVLWAASRKDLLSAFFFLWTLLLYQKESRWALLTFGLGLLSKVSIAVLPVILILIDVWEGRSITKDSLKEKKYYFGLSILFGLLAIFGKTTNIGSVSVIDTALIGGQSVLHSLKMMFMPVGLSPIYPVSDGVSWMFLVAALVLFSGLVAPRKKFVIIPWCAAWFLVLYAPHLLTFSRNGYLFLASDRAAYLSGVGVFLLISFLISTVASRYNTLKIPLAAVCVVAVGALAFSTRTHAAIWKNSETLARTNVHPLFLNNLGATLNAQGKPEEAIAAYMKSAELGLPQAHYNAARMYAQNGDREKAFTLYDLGMNAARERGVHGTPDLAPHFAAAQILLDQGKTAQGIAVLEEAVQLGDHVASAHMNLGMQYLNTGKLTSAEKHLVRATMLNRFSAPAHYNLAYLYIRLAKRDKAITALKRTVRIDPNYQDAAQRLQELRGR